MKAVVTLLSALLLAGGFLSPPLPGADSVTSEKVTEVTDVGGRKYPLVPSTPREASVPIKTTDVCLLKWDFDGPDFKLLKNGSLAGNGYKSVPSSWAQLLPYAKEEGESLCRVARYSVVPSGLPGGGNALQYFLGPQKPTDPKARTEHYLTVENFDKPYVSDFSLKLHPGFTPIDLKRPDGGSAWCCLRQWHQGVPIPPPMALSLKQGTRDVISTGFGWGTYKGGKSGKTYGTRSSEKQIQLGQWYHFRFEWRIAPGTDRSYCKVWMSAQRKGDQLTAEDMWCNYHGPIGYVALDGKPSWDGHPIREQEGLYQNSHLAPAAFHAVIYDNVSIHLRN